MKKFFLILFAAVLMIGAQNVLSYATGGSGGEFADPEHLDNSNSTSQNVQDHQFDLHAEINPFLANIPSEDDFMSQDGRIIFGIFTRSPYEIGSSLLRPGRR